jgi:iron complex outermembrane receptor protein
MKRSRQLVLAIVFLIPFFVSAQEIIKGNVKDELGTDLPGVSVIVKGTTSGTATDFDGNFELEVGDPNVTLVFSYIGYMTIEMEASADMQVVLKESAESLDEVVLIGYGQTTKKDATGAVERVSEKEFNVGLIASPEQLITGKTAGVNVVPPSGRPGEGGTVKIRGGVSSLGNNSPLYVIDGIPIDQTEGPALNSINPNDIESFNILKDASATAIYGSRATNGVIIITTKSGRMNSDMRVEFDSKFSVGYKSNTVDNLTRDEFVDFVTNSLGNQDAIDELTDDETDWQEEIYRPAFGTDNNLTFSQGFENTSYRIALGYLYQDGIVKTNDYSRKSFAMNVRQNAFDNHLKMDFNLRGAWITDDFNNGGVIGSAVQFDPTKPIFSGSPEYGGYWEWLDPNGSGAPNNLAPRNPVGLLNQYEERARTSRYIGNAKFDYKFHFLEDLKLVMNFGFDYASVDGKRVTPATSASGFNTQGSVEDYTQLKRNLLADIYLNYNKTFNDVHNLDLTLGHSFQDFYKERTNLFVPGRGEERDIRIVNLNALQSIFTRVNYGYDNRYLVTFTYRRDGSSRFSPENRWANFFSGALAWNIAEEDFLADSQTISTLKLRLGFGQTGQQEIEADFGYLPVYTPGLPNVSYPFGDDYYSTLRPDGYDSNIKWEESDTYNIGLDFGFSGDVVTGSLEYFQRQSEDILNRVAPPAGTNLTNEIYTNIGDLESSGVEFTLNADLFQRENFTWNLSFNATYLTNKIKKLNSVDDPDFVGLPVGGISGGVGNTVQTQQVGQPQFSYLVYEQVYDESGNPLEGVYVDQNGDGVINDSDKRIYKNPNPDYLFGFSSYMTFYQNWDFSFTMRASLGNYAYNNVASANGVYAGVWELNSLRNAHSSLLETDFREQQFWSDYYVQDASFLRMDNVALGYSFPNLNEGNTRLRLYTTVQNVFVLTPYEGVDPEINGGIDNNFYPRPRTFLLGLNLNF